MTQSRLGGLTTTMGRELSLGSLSPQEAVEVCSGRPQTTRVQPPTATPWARWDSEAARPLRSRKEPALGHIHSQLRKPCILGRGSPRCQALLGLRECHRVEQALGYTLSRGSLRGDPADTAPGGPPPTCPPQSPDPHLHPDLQLALRDFTPP